MRPKGSGLRRPGPFFITPAEIRDQLESTANPRRAAFSLRYFRCQKGEPGYGDRFFGNTVPECRKLAKQTSRSEEWRWRTPGARAKIGTLLGSEWHEERLIALLILVDLFGRVAPKTGREADSTEAREIAEFYLANLDHIDNWDLVDTSAPQILGRWLFETRGPGPHALLTRLARSRKSKWERRVAVVATQWMMRQGSTREALRIAELLLKDDEDLIHKAAGWMVRVAGDVDREALHGFLKKHSAAMPRTMLRYSIEHLTPVQRKHWLSRLGES